MQALRHYLLAVQFFTRIPVTGRTAAWVGYSPALLRASAGHLPGVGWLVAAVAVAVHAALAWALGPQPAAPWVCAVFSTVATVLVTGFHEDGLADVADGLGGSLQRERALEIMKDSRIGAFGAMALVLALAAKLALLSLLGAGGLGVVLPALAAAHVLSRFWPLVLVRTLAHVGDTATSKSKPLADQISGRSLATALLWSIGSLALMGYALGIAVWIASLAASALAALGMRRWFARRLGGFTGDCLGATQQIGEIAIYLATAIALGGRLAVTQRRLWLVRHALPLVAPGVCYGALDVPADPAATADAARRLTRALPGTLADMRHSPLQRCEQLAQALMALKADSASEPDARLAEMDFGTWEGRAWDAIARADIDAWTADFGAPRASGGDSLAAMLLRVDAALAEARRLSHDRGGDVLWITHAGVARCVQWLQARPGRLPRADEWPVAAPAYGEWTTVPLDAPAH